LAEREFTTAYQQAQAQGYTGNELLVRTIALAQRYRGFENPQSPANGRVRAAVNRFTQQPAPTGSSQVPRIHPVGENPTSNEIVRTTGISQFDIQVDRNTAEWICGPVAVQWFVTATGRNPAWTEVFNLAREFDPEIGQPRWIAGQGASGPRSMVNLINRLGVNSYMENWRPQIVNRIRDEVLAGRPVIIDTIGHYYQVTGYNSRTGMFKLGDGVGRRAVGGVDLNRLGQIFPAYGPPRTVIFLGDSAQAD
jgi:hypothetical protein